MIQFAVIFEWNPSVTRADVEAFEIALDRIASITPGMREYRFGPEVRSEGGAGDFGIVAIFDDEVDVQAWVEHPDHRAVTKDFTRRLVATSWSMQFEISNGC